MTGKATAWPERQRTWRNIPTDRQSFSKEIGIFRATRGPTRPLIVVPDTLSIGWRDNLEAGVSKLPHSCRTLQNLMPAPASAGSDCGLAYTHSVKCANLAKSRSSVRLLWPRNASRPPWFQCLSHGKRFAVTPIIRLTDCLVPAGQPRKEKESSCPFAVPSRCFSLFA